MGAMAVFRYTRSVRGPSVPREAVAGDITGPPCSILQDKESYEYQYVGDAGGAPDDEDPNGGPQNRRLQDKGGQDDPGRGRRLRQHAATTKKIEGDAGHGADRHDADIEVGMGHDGLQVRSRGQSRHPRDRGKGCVSDT